jgi:deoxyribose-phosphate aldolase
MYSKQQVAATMDHAVLKPYNTDQDIIHNARMCVQYGVASMCVRPSDVALAARELKGSAVKVSAVVGFPHGAHRPETKALESRLALDDGAVELDMVMNIGKFKSGDFAWVQRDIEAVVAEARPRAALVKVILETCWLSPAEIVKACEISLAAGADFVKTSTGFGDGPATPEAVEVMLKSVGGRIGVKASGGIRTWETAASYLRQGCKRLGVASTQAIMEGAPADDAY